MLPHYDNEYQMNFLCDEFFFTILLTDQLSDFGSDDEKNKCIATTSCDGKNNFKRGYRKCDDQENNYDVICGKKYLLTPFLILFK